MASNDGYIYIDAGNLLEIADGEREFMEEIILYYIDNCVAYFMEFENAIIANDYEKALFEVHKIKGLFKIISCEPLVVLSEKVEQMCVDKATTELILDTFKEVKTVSDKAEHELKLLIGGV